MQEESRARHAVALAAMSAYFVGGILALVNILEMILTKLDVQVRSNAGAFSPVWVLAGLVLIDLSYRIRSGRLAWIPLATILQFIAFAQLGWSNLSKMLDEIVKAGWPIGFWEPVSIILGMIVPIACLLSALNGLRGWSWLRIHHIAGKS